MEDPEERTEQEEMRRVGVGRTLSLATSTRRRGGRDRKKDMHVEITN